jgi:ATP-dependent DNA ligase
VLTGSYRRCAVLSSDDGCESLRFSPLPVGFVPPCLPISAKQAQIGSEWLIEIKHDGFRVIARKEGKRVRLYSRPGNDLTRRFESLAPTEIGLAARSQIAELLDKGASFVRRLLPLKVRSSLFHSQHLWRVQGEP